MKGIGLLLISVVTTQLISSNDLCADEVSERTEMSMQTPIALFSGAALGKSSDNVNSYVDMYTGKANISIPLHVIQVDGLNIPIIISYQTGGIKVTDAAGLVGLGWNFSAGGKISRAVSGPNGDFDDAFGHHSDGYIKGRGDDPDILERHIAQLFQESNYNENLVYSPIMHYWYEFFEDRDTRPDMFYYEIPGASGMFMFGSDMKGYGFPYQFMSITSLDVDGQRLKVADNNGYEYYFGAVVTEEGEFDDSGIERTTYESMHNRSKKFASTWNLRKIVKDGRTVASFTYSQGESYSYQPESFYFKTKFFGNILNSAVRYPVKNNQVIYYPSYLTSIKTEHEEINFFYNNELRNDGFHEDGRDYFVGMTLLEKIEVKYDGKKLKTVTLDYGSFDINNYPKLQGITEQIRDADPDTIYTFDYEESVNLPRWNSMSYDYWGYYNGANDDVLAGIDNLMPSFTWSDSVNNLAYSFSGKISRESSFLYTKANSLTRIKYKEGGFREFEYEPHETDDGKIVGGLRIRSIADYVTEGVVASKVYYTYKNLETGKSSGRCFFYPYGTAILNYQTQLLTGILGSRSFLVYDRYPFQLEDYNGAAIVYPMAQERYLNGGYKNMNYYSFDDYQDIKGSVRLIGAHHSSFSYPMDYRHVPSTSYWWARGMIKAIEIYNASNELEICERYIYELDPEPRKVFVDRIPFISLLEQYAVSIDENKFKHNLFKISEHNWISQVLRLKKHIIEKGKNNFANETTYEYWEDFGIPVSMEKTDGVDTIKTITRYPFAYSFNDSIQSSIEYNALKALMDKNVHVPVEQYVIKNGRVVSGNVSTFKQIQCFDNTISIKPWKSLSLIVDKPLDNYRPSYFDHGTLVCDSRYLVQQSVDYYDINGYATNVYSPLMAKTNSVVLDKFGNIIAEIQNAVYTDVSDERLNQVFYTSFEDDSLASGLICIDKAKTGNCVMTQPYMVDLSNFQVGQYTLSYWKSQDGGDTWQKVSQNIQVQNDVVSFEVGEECWWIDEVRIGPVDAIFSTASYNPGIGKTSEMDHNGRVKYYEYDNHGRLSRVLNNDKEAVEEYQYHIGNSNN